MSILLKILSLLPLGMGVWAFFMPDVPWHVALPITIVGVLCVFAFWSNSKSARWIALLLTSAHALDEVSDSSDGPNEDS